MVRATLHRKENGQTVPIGRAVFYIKEGEIWRFASKPEVDLLEIQSPINVPIAGPSPVRISADLPNDQDGEDGDYYALIYSVDWTGPVWLEQS